MVKLHEAVDTCAKNGKEPQPYSGRVIFRVDPEAHRKAALQQRCQERA
ncbi:toxin-antitoxin system HicB family antitoxin [Oceaniovalibus sp. ACAM 378]|nr:toxin-antitoxin system HicB family antitoxin [Oceaniovalibus sp. ACAM 378]